MCLYVQVSEPDGTKAYEAAGELLKVLSAPARLAIVMELAEQRAPNGFKRIEDVITHGELADIASAYKVAAGFDPKELNSRPSLSVPHPTA